MGVTRWNAETDVVTGRLTGDWMGDRTWNTECIWRREKDDAVKSRALMCAGHLVCIRAGARVLPTRSVRPELVAVATATDHVLRQSVYKFYTVREVGIPLDDEITMYVFNDAAVAQVRANRHRAVRDLCLKLIPSNPITGVCQRSSSSHHKQMRTGHHPRPVCHPLPRHDNARPDMPKHQTLCPGTS